MSDGTANASHKAIDRFESLLGHARARTKDTPYKLAKAARIPLTSAYRQIAALEEARLISRDIQGRYMIGAQGRRISFAAWGFEDPGFVVEPLLKFVRLQTRSTSFLGFHGSGVLQLGPYSIGRGSTFVRPDGSGEYRFGLKLPQLETGSYAVLKGSGAALPVLLSPVFKTRTAALVLGAFSLKESAESRQGDLSIVRDAALRLRTGMNLQGGDARG